MRDDRFVFPDGAGRRRTATLVAAVALSLTVWLMGGPAWGQPAAPATGPAKSAAPPAAREAKSGVPVDDLDRGTPRRAVEGFLEATRKHDYHTAAGYLSLRHFSDWDGPTLARQLKVVLDQAVPIDAEALSDSPDGQHNDGLPADVEQLGRIETRRGPVHLRLRRVQRDDGVEIWKFSDSTVDAVPRLYERYTYGPLTEALPWPIFDTEFLDTQLRQWLALPVIVGLGYVFGLLVTSAGLGLARRRRSELVSALGRFVVGPVRLVILVLVLSVARQPLLLSLTVDRVLTVVEQVLLIIAVAWTTLRVAESLEEVVRNRALRRGKITLLPLLPVVRRTANILIMTFAALGVLHCLGVNVVTVLAGLGVGGIAVALAAQKTVENFIGGITLYADQPVRVGEFCRFGGTVGTVEEVGLRSTRVRTLDRTVVTIPNGEFSNLQIENFARRERIWYHPTIGLRYETTPDQIRYVLVEVRRMLYAHPKVDSASARIRFVGFGQSSADLEVFSYVNESDYGAFLEVAEDLNLRIMDIVAEAGSSFAFPSQTTYFERGTGLDRDRARAAEAKVKEWRERRELCLPRFPPEKIAEVESTLEYPPAGAALSPGHERR